MLRPGPELFRRVGGIHEFMGWPGPVLTDSGGYQIFSLAGRPHAERGGRALSRYTDQRIHMLSPERSIAMQTAIGSDIMMVLDVCVDSTLRRGGDARRDGADAPLGAAQPRRARRTPSRRSSPSSRGA